MGIIRFLLALSVFFSHLRITGNNYFLNNGSEAVELFFIISGFYMFLTYESKYMKLKSYSKYYFYSNRFLRIYPTYFIVLLLSIGYAIYSSKYSPDLHNKLAAYVAYKDHLSASSYYLLGFLNISLVGLEIMDFFKIYGSGFIMKLSSNKDIGDNLLSQFQMVPQAWSLGMEFWFYLLCPFFVKLKNKSILKLLLGLLICKIFFMYFVSNAYNWEFRFIFFELILFLLGGFVYSFFKMKQLINIKFSVWVFVLIFISILFLNTFAHLFFIKWCFYFLFAFSIPLVFDLFKNNKFDKLLGELSFPLYIGQALIIMLAREFVYESEWIRIVFIICALLIFSFVLLRLSNPIEKYRANRLSNK